MGVLTSFQRVFLPIATVATLLFVAPARADIAENGTALNGVNLNGVNLNGVNLNGVNLNGVNLNGVNLNGVNLNGVNLNGNLLVGSIAGTAACEAVVATVEPGCASHWTPECDDVAEDLCELDAFQLIGATLTATTSDGGTVTLRIDHVDWSPIRADVVLYTMTWHDGTAWLPLCSGGDETIAVGGTWADCAGIDGCGGKVSSSGLTLACRRSAIAKCAEDIGYVPWSGQNVCTGGGCSFVSYDPYHQSCVRMVRGDYCGIGVATTRDGTPINVFDALPSPIQSLDSTVNWGFEAEWNPGAAACISTVRWQSEVMVAWEIADGTWMMSMAVDAFVDSYCPERRDSFEDTMGLCGDLAAEMKAAPYGLLGNHSSTLALESASRGEDGTVRTREDFAK